MSIVSKVTEAIVRFVPDRNRDELSDAERVMGKPIDRLDAVEKVTGHARFSAEYPLDNLAYAALVYSGIAKGTIKSIDIGQAERARGVIAVLTHENAPKMVNPPLFSMEGGSEAAGSKANVLNTDTIYWNGQPVAMVVADTLERAEHACSLIRIEYQQESAHVSFMDEKVHATVPKDVMRQDPEVRRGDAEAAFTKAPYQTDQIYVTPRYNHNAIEMHATTAVWHGDHLTVYATSQFVQGVRHSLAKMFSLSKENVRVLAPFVGGGFGGKGPMWSHVQLCALAAKVTKRPVKLPLSREGVFRIVGGRTASEQRVAIGVDKTGADPHRCHRHFHHERIRRTVFVSRAASVRRRQPLFRPKSHYARHGSEYVHARARRIHWHLRARIRHRRSGRHARDGSCRDPSPQRSR